MSGRSYSEDAAICACRTRFPQKLAESSVKVHRVEQGAVYSDLIHDDLEQDDIDALAAERQEGPDIVPEEEAIDVAVTQKQLRELIKTER